MKLDEALTALRKSGTRSFLQSVDLIVSFRNLDLKKPENKFSKDVLLPHGRGKDVSVGIISDSIPGAVGKGHLETLDKNGIKDLAKNHEFFLCEAPLMATVGKVLGRYLGPKGKMPRLLPPGRDHNAIAEDMKRSVRIRITNAPVIHTVVGNEAMTDAQIKENVVHVLEEVKKSIPQKAQVRNVYLKLTMGRPVKVDTHGW